MKWIKDQYARQQRRWRRYRRRRAAKKYSGNPRREFVYLDEVSVYSLMASRIGPMATEFTDTETQSLSTELGSSFTAKVPGLKSGASSKVGESHSSSSQVIRKSIVQTTFKELMEYDLDSLIVSIPDSDATKNPPPHRVTLEDLRAAKRRKDLDRWVIDPAAFQRGELLEIEVGLEADTTYRMSTVIRAMVEMVGDSPQVFKDVHGLGEAADAGRVLEKLLVGLVPIRGQAIDFVIADLSDREIVVHRKVLDALPEDSRPSTRPLFVVGVAEEELFWKDIRRLLFSNSPYRLLCRVARPGLRNEWTPVKLADVLSEVIPSIRSDMSELMLQMQDATSKSDSHSTLAIRVALTAFAASLAREHDGVPVSESAIDFVIAAHGGDDGFAHIDNRRAMFLDVESLSLEERKLESDTALSLRTGALRAAGIDPDGTIRSNNARPDAAATANRLLEVEFVAMYW